jgi:ABC-type glycerol-3-phosphate transport system substrate-binding protein
LDSLTATSAAAPQSLPDLIALSRPDMEMAALKGLIFPLERFTEIPDDSNWYAFTREMALLQGSTFGLPFAADSLAIVYRPANVPGFTGVFADLVETQNQLTFPAGSDLSIYQLALYLSEGGQVQDNQRRPKLDVDPLTNVFRLMQEGVGGGVFSPEFIDFQNDNQVWDTFRDGQTHMVVTWVSNYLQNGPADARLIPLLSNADNPITIGTGMSWSVATPNESRQQLAVELAEYLVAPDYLHAWSLAAGYIPSRPSAMENWPDQGLRAIISQIALTTYLHPSNDIMTSIGPVLREGTIQVLRDMMDPSQAASVAVETLED